MKRLTFLVSGGGGNLKFIYEYLKLSLLKDFMIECVIADRECKALEFAKRNNIQSFCIRYDKENTKELEALLIKINPDVIVTTFHKIIDDNILSQFQGKLINLHYSLLPAFKGMIGTKPIQEALHAGCKLIGTTTHFVTKELDGGKIISQSAFAVGDEYLFDNVLETIFQSGCLSLLNSLFIVCLLGKSTVLEEYTLARFNDKLTIFSPVLRFNYDCFTKDFFQRLKNET